MRVPPPPPWAAAAAASAAARRPGLGEVGGVGEPGGVADDDPDAGAPVATGGELLDLAVVEHAPTSDRLSSAKTSAKSPPVRSAAPSTREITASSITGRPFVG